MIILKFIVDVIGQYSIFEWLLCCVLILKLTHISDFFHSISKASLGSGKNVQHSFCKVGQQPDQGGRHQVVPGKVRRCHRVQPGQVDQENHCSRWTYVKKTFIMNSSMCVVETPKKRFISVKSCKSPLSVLKTHRFSPSKHLLSLMINVDRIHKFQYHIEVAFTDLRELHFMTRSMVNSVTDFFISESPDIPDFLVKLEIIAIEQDYFGQFLKEYIAEEFGIPSEFSFCVVAILNYMKLFNISVKDALCDFFSVHSRNSLKLLL